MFRPQRTVSTEAFLARFGQWEGELARRQLVRGALSGAAVGGVVSVVGATALWATGHGAWVPLSTVSIALGAAVGGALAWRRRWSSEAVALYLDARLGSPETITTAAALARESLDPVGALVVAEAGALLASVRPSMLPLRFAGHQSMALVALLWAATLGWVSRPHTASTPARAVEPWVQSDQVSGLRAVERLRTVATVDPQRRQRLTELAQQARRLSEQLATGLPRAAAMQSLHDLEERLRSEQDVFRASREQTGLERAATRLSEAGFASAAEALRDHDLEALDRAMERIANARESSDRERARQALRDAANAAEQAGAQATARSLREEESLLHQRAARNTLMRQMAEQLGRDEAVRHAAEHLDRLPSEQSARDLAEQLERALAGLTPEERSRLTERLRQALSRPQPMQHAQPGQSSSQEGEGQPAAPQSAEQLRQMLRDLANADPSQQGEGEGEGQGGQSSGQSSGGAMIPIPMPGQGTSSMRAQAALGQAADGAAQARDQLNGQGQGAQGQEGQGSGQGQNPEAGGPSRGGGPGNHRGQTQAARGDSFRARVGGRLQGGASGASRSGGFQAGREGGVARVAHTGALETAAPSALRGVDRSDIPAEYRDHVHLYFQP